MHIIKTSPFQRDIIQYISESFLLMIRYLFKKGLTLLSIKFETRVTM